MKKLIPLIFALALPAYAGDSGKEVIPPPAEPCLVSWFAGGSVGYLTEFDESMYHLHFGQDTCIQLGGWDFAWFAEIGYAESDGSYSAGNFNYDFIIMPLTINGKLERKLTGNLNTYFGAGIGMAKVDYDVDLGGSSSSSDNDWVCTAQVFAGVNYHLNESCEIYSGARWIHFDEVYFAPSTLKLEDDLLLEFGFRYNFK